MESLMVELKNKGWYGTIDRLQRGIITADQARAELNGDKSHMNIKPLEHVDGVFGYSWEQIETMQGGKLKR